MKEIVFTGRLTKEKLKELYQTHYGEAPTAIQEMEHSIKPKQPDSWNPHQNHNLISIHKGEDGNWTATGFFQQMMKKIRTNDPQTALQYLITGQGEAL